MGLVKDWKGNDTGFAFALVAGIPQHAVVPGTLAIRDFAWCASSILFINEIIGFRPAQDKAGTPHKSLCQPGIACKAAIPNM